MIHTSNLRIQMPPGLVDMNFAAQSVAPIKKSKLVTSLKLVKYTFKPGHDLTEQLLGILKQYLC